MRFLIGIGVLAMASICVPAALADVSYDINFGGGTDGTTGSFSYNSTTATFSSFTINWDAYTFGIADFLANESPNSPQLYLDPVATAVCGSSTPAADLFAVLTGLCSIYPSGEAPRQWEAFSAIDTITGATFAQFTFGTAPAPSDVTFSLSAEIDSSDDETVSSGCNNFYGAYGPDPCAVTLVSAGGLGIESATTQVPEQSALILLLTYLTTLAALAFVARKRICHLISSGLRAVQGAQI